MRTILFLTFLTAQSLQLVDTLKLEDIRKFLELSVEHPFNAVPKESSPTQDQYTKNIFLRTDIKPSLITTFMNLLSFIVPILVHDLPLGNLTIKIDDLGLDANFTKIVLHSIEIEDADVSGLLPESDKIVNFVLPKFNGELSFDYSIKFGHDRPESGSANVSFEGLTWQAKFEMTQALVQHKPEGNISLVLHSNAFNFTKFTGTFSDPFTQTEWDVLFSKPDLLKKTITAVLGSTIKKALKDVDMRQLLTIKSGKGGSLVFGFTDPMLFPTASGAAPDNRSIKFLFHSVATTSKGVVMDGLFPVDLKQPALSDKYTSFILTSDFFNRILKALTYEQAIGFSFNEQFLNKSGIDLIKLDTTSMKPFFPTLESKFGPNMGLYINFTLPKYDDNQCYVRANAGFLNFIISASVEVWACLDNQIYNTTSLKDCVAQDKCKLGITNLLEFRLSLPLQFTDEKNIAFGFLDVEVTNVEQSPGTQEDANQFKEKLNNFLDIALPHLLPEIKIGALLAPFLVSVDTLDDQRIVLGLDLDQTEKKNLVQK